jgi:hypothetical protein
MAGATRKWLIGCGSGCGLVVLILVFLGFGAVRIFTSTVERIDRFEASQDRLETRLGAIEDYVPPRDGVVPDDRVAIFLEVREETAPSREMLERTIGGLPPARGRIVGPVRGFRYLRAFARFLPAMGEYLDERNQVLLDRGMGLGEYVFIHTLAYHWWLGHSPLDGPESVLGTSGDRGASTGLVLFDDESDLGERKAAARYGRLVRTLLRNWLEALPEEAGRQGEAGWRDRLTRELAALEADPDRTPWDGDPPAAMTRTLEPYRERLEASYGPVTNRLDLLVSGSAIRDWE